MMGDERSKQVPTPFFALVTMYGKGSSCVLNLCVSVILRYLVCVCGGAWGGWHVYGMVAASL